jgi:16S rRNA processing protein RimM
MTTRVVGRVVKPHGIHGELVVELRTDSPDVRFALGVSLTASLRDGSERPVTITAARPHTGRLLVRFEQVDGRDAADEMRGALLSADIADLPPVTDPDEFYDHELEGLTVSTVDGEAVGTLREVLHGAGGDLLVVRRDSGPDVLVPFVRQIVPEIDVAAGRVRIDPPEGLLDVE